MSKPSNKYIPLVTVSNNPIMFIKVVLPEPDGPIIAIKSPLFILKLIPFKTLTASPLINNPFLN